MLRRLLFVLMMVSAAGALFLAPALSAAAVRGAISTYWLFIPCSLYAVFLLVYAYDRWSLVKRRGYPSGKAFFQVAFGVVFALLLLPSTIGDWKAKQPQGMAKLIRHSDPDVRAIAVELLAYRGESKKSMSMILPMLDDGDPRVSAAALLALSRWAGAPGMQPADARNWAKTRVGQTPVGWEEEVR